MEPMPTRMIDALPRDHVVAVKAQILEGDQVIYDLTDAGVVVGGTVNVSRSEIQRTVSGLTLIDRDGTLTPRDMDDLLAPVGNQIRLWRGILYDPPPTGPGEDVDLVPLITARFSALKSTYPVIELSEVSDRSWIVQGAKRETPLTIPAGTGVTDAIEAMLSAAMPGVETRFPIVDETTNSMTLDVEGDPWQFCQEIAANTGHLLHFDPMGIATMIPEASVDSEPVWMYDDTSGATVPGVNMGLSGTGQSWQGVGFNVVVVIAENSDLAAPIQAVARDLDPLSPTYYGGKYGIRVAPVIRDEKIASVSQAQLRAVKELQAQLGISQSLTVPTMVNPAFAVGDVVGVYLARGLVEPLVIQSGVIDQFSVPLRAGEPQMLDLRARRIAVGEE